MSRLGRFRRIEPRRPADQLELAPDDVPGAARAKLERRARAEEELAALAREREQHALARQPTAAPSWLDRPPVHALARLTTTGRVVVLGIATLVIGVLAQLTGPVAWGLLPVVAAVVIGSHYLHVT